MKRKIISSVSALTVSLLMLLLLIYEETAAESAKKAMLISVNSVIPQLFTYMVLSSVITELDLLEPIYRYIPTNRLFSLPRCTAPVILTGLVCGFPVGAAGTKSLFDSSKITLNEAGLLLCISSCASPAFLIGSVGGWWGDKRFGIMLYSTSVITVLCVGIVLGKKNSYAAENAVQEKNINKSGIISAVCSSVSKAAVTCLTVTAYITFFSVLRAMFTELIPALGFVFASVFEFSSGARYGSVVSGCMGAAISGFSVGFSSLSIFMQTYNIIGSSPIPMRYFTLSKILNGITSALAAALYNLLCPMSPKAETASVMSPYPAARVISAIIILSIVAIYCYKCRKKNNFNAKY